MGSQVFTTTGANTWNWPTGVTQVTVELIGGGGAGGGATGNPANGGGGRGGGYSKKVITKGVESSLTVNVGTGGVGGTTANGSNATVSSVVQNGSTVQTAVAGASAAANQTTTTGAGATTDIGSAQGDTTFSGGSGSAGASSSSGAGGGSAGPTSAGGNASGTTGGGAGTGTFGDGTTRQVAGRNGVAASSAGTAGINYGGAGSGGAAGNATDRTGGSGAQGIAVLTWVDPPPTQDSFRFYADGTESGSTALANQDTNYTADLSGGDLNMALRLRLQQLSGSGGATTDDYELFVSRNGGTYYRFPMFRAAVAGSSPPGSGNLYGFSTGNNAVGQTIIGAGQTLTGIIVGLKQNSALGSYSSNIFAKVYAITGTFGSGSEVPTGAALATSDALNPSSLSTSDAEYTITFSGGNQITLTDGTAYAIVIEFTGATVANDLIIIDENSIATFGDIHPGSQVSRNTSTWSNQGSTKNFYFKLQPTSERVQPFNSSNFAEGDATTNRLGAGTGSFVAGKISEDDEVNDLQITTSNYTELLFSFSLGSILLANNDTLDFKVYKNGVALNTYNVTPRITVSKPAAIFTKNIFVEQAVNRAATY